MDATSELAEIEPMNENQSSEANSRNNDGNVQPESSSDGQNDDNQSEGSNLEPWTILDEAKDLIPSDWGEPKPNKKATRGKEGLRWTDPDDKGNGIRIDKGDLNSKFSTQQVDHVVVNYKGKVIGRDGKPIQGSIADNPKQSHIPLSEWQNWQNWYSP